MRKCTFGTSFHRSIFHNVKSFSQFTYDTSIFLINKNNLSSFMRTGTALYIAFSRLECRRVIRCDWTFFFALGSAGSCTLWCGCSFEKGCTLCKDSLECINVFLRSSAFAYTWKFYPCKCAALWTKVPSWDKVATGWLMVDLGCSWKWEVEFGRKMKMEVEVFFWGGRLRVCRGKAREW